METNKECETLNNNKGEIWIRWSGKVENLLNAVDGHLINACQYFREIKPIHSSNKELFYEDCAALAIYHMLRDFETFVNNYSVECYLTYIEPKTLGSFVTRLEILESAVEEYYKELDARNINPEYVLSDLYKAISELQVFLHEFNLSA
nr:MAG TPA: hypothetical protein [Caudoviricetes sp.]